MLARIQQNKNDIIACNVYLQYIDIFKLPKLIKEQIILAQYCDFDFLIFLLITIEL